jgi:gas vesicle protein
MGSGKVLLGVLAGVAVGATLGILFAPDKGFATRKKILEKGDEYSEDLQAKFNELCGTLTKKFEEMKEEAVRMMPETEGTQEEEKRDTNTSVS